MQLARLCVISGTVSTQVCYLCRQLSLVDTVPEPGVNAAAIFEPELRGTWVQRLLEWYQQLELEEMAAYPAGIHVAAIEVSIHGVVASLEAIE